MYPSRINWASRALAWHGDRFPIKQDSPRSNNEKLEGEITKSIISSTRSWGEKCDDEKFDSSNWKFFNKSEVFSISWQKISISTDQL